jgi:hypothetical protein
MEWSLFPVPGTRTDIYSLWGLTELPAGNPFGFLDIDIRPVDAPIMKVGQPYERITRMMSSQVRRTRVTFMSR